MAASLVEAVFLLAVDIIELDNGLIVAGMEDSPMVINILTCEKSVTSEH